MPGGMHSCKFPGQAGQLVKVLARCAVPFSLWYPGISVIIKIAMPQKNII